MTDADGDVARDPAGPRPPAGVTVRAPRPQDARDWARFAAAERARTYAAIMPPWFGPQELDEAERSAPRWAASFAAPGDHRRLVAEHDGELVGVADEGPAPAAWEVGLGLVPALAPRSLDLLYLRPDQHGSGLADALLTGVLGDGPVYLWLIDGNARAERFYVRRGFRHVEERVSTGPTWGNVPMHRMLRS